MYKSRTGGHNKSSTKEKRNTYPPLFSKLRRENTLGLIFFLTLKFFCVIVIHIWRERQTYNQNKSSVFSSAEET